MRAFTLFVLAACTSSPPTTTVTVVALAGDMPDQGASILSHRSDGSVIDAETPDPNGSAEVAVEPGALISVVFASTTIQVVTAPAPAARLVVHGPPLESTPAGVGALAIKPMMALAADGGFDVELGCVTVHEATLPATIDLLGACLGSDTNLDVLIHALDASQHEIGYAAGRAPLVGDVAELDPAAWSTTGTAVPVMADGVSPAVTWTLTADGLRFDAATITAGGELPDGLAVDGAVVTATLGQAAAAQTTIYSITGAPSTIAIAADDFLPAIAPSLTHSSNTFAWAAGPAADAVDLRVAWAGVVWDAVLPADSTSITYPDLQFAPPMPVGIQLRYVDASDLTSLGDATDLYVEQAAGVDQIFLAPHGGKLAVALTTATL